MMVCMNEWAHHASIWVAPQKLRLLSLFRDKSFFIFCTFAEWQICPGEHICCPNQLYISSRERGDFDGKT